MTAPIELPGTGYRIDNSPDGWVGNGTMRGGKGYVATAAGQIHYRMIGAGASLPVVLIHQTPWSISQYAGIQPALAARGVASLALDTPGFGMSDAPPRQPSIDDYVDWAIEALDALGIDRIVVAGHHTGATIAMRMAVLHPARVAGLVIHGVALFEEEERRERLARPPYVRGLKADGSHFTDKFATVYANTDKTPENLVASTWSVINFFLSGATDTAYPAVFAHDIESDIAAVAVPTLLLSDAADGLHTHDLKVAAMRPDFSYILLSQGSGHAFVNDPEPWADAVASFVETIR